MPENPKKKDDGTVAKDQKERGYYYDDAHGYEEYVPEAEDEDNRDEEAGDPATPKERPQADLPDLRIPPR